MTHSHHSATSTQQKHEAYSPMLPIVKCPQCNTAYSVPVHFLHKNAICAMCGHTFVAESLSLGATHHQSHSCARDAKSNNSINSEKPAWHSEPHTLKCNEENAAFQRITCIPPNKRFYVLGALIGVFFVIFFLYHIEAFGALAVILWLRILGAFF